MQASAPTTTNDGQNKTSTRFITATGMTTAGCTAGESTANRSTQLEKASVPSTLVRPWPLNARQGETMKQQLRQHAENDLLRFEIKNKTYYALPLADWEGYYATTCGHIISAKRKQLKVKTNVLHANGYQYVGLCGPDRLRQKVRVHRLIAKTFLQSPSDDRQGRMRLEVNHLDCDKLNNKVVNLEWCSHVENLDHFRLIKSIKAQQAAKEENGGYGNAA